MGSIPISRSTFHLYILYSKTLDRFYIGITGRIRKRLAQHRRGTSVWTTRAQDWQEVYRQEVPTMTQARQLEKAVKARGARRFLLDMNACPTPDQASFPIPPTAGQG